MSREICNICVEPYTKLKRKKLDCGSCGYDFCCECLRNYVLTTKDVSPKCISGCCDQRMRYIELNQKLPKTFIKSFVGDLLFEEERNKIEDFKIKSFYDMKRNEQDIRIMLLKKEWDDILISVKDYDRRINNIKNTGELYCMICAMSYTPSQRKKIICGGCGYKCCSECLATAFAFYGSPRCIRRGCSFEFSLDIGKARYVQYLVDGHYTGIDNPMFYDDPRLIRHMETVLNNVKEKKIVIEENLNMVKSEIEQRILLVSEIERERGNNIRKICADPSCSGICIPGRINSGFSECQVCNQIYCSDCEGIVSCIQSHECDKDVLENIKSIRAETRPCPSCLKPIFKISGCDQMFCTLCFVKFDWISGKIMSKKAPFHNIHFANRVNSIRVEENMEIFKTFSRKLNSDVEWNHNKENKLYVEIFTRLIHDVLPNMDINLINLNSECLFNRERLMSSYIEDRIDEGVYKKELFKFYNNKKYQEEIYEEFTSLASNMLEVMVEFNNNRLGGGDVSSKLYKIINELVSKLEGRVNVNEVHWYRRVLRRFENN